LECSFQLSNWVSLVRFDDDDGNGSLTSQIALFTEREPTVVVTLRPTN